MRLKQEGSSSLGSIVAVDGSKNRIDPNEVVFPIFKELSVGNLELIGTGFFVTKFGVFITAKHVLTDVLGDGSHSEQRIMIPHFVDGGFLLRPVISGALNNNSDIGLGMCKYLEHKVTGEPLTNKILNLTNRQPKENEPIHTYAFPDSEHSSIEKTFQLMPNYYAGNITEFFPNGRDRTMLPNPCYQTTINIHHGASGGPVFNKKGRVFGVNSSCLTGTPVISYVSSIVDCFGLKINGVKHPTTTDEATLYDYANINMASIVDD